MSATVGRLAVQRFRWNEMRRAVSKSPILPNPFIPKLSSNKTWIKPKYSLRQQADLVKHARAAGLLHLLPAGPKADHDDIKSAVDTLRLSLPTAETSIHGSSSSSSLSSDGPPLEWAETYHARKVPGASIGARLYSGKKRMFKGHKWQRLLAQRKAKLAMRLRTMSQRIHRWRMHRIRFLRNPASPARTTKSTKLPF